MTEAEIKSIVADIDTDGRGVIDYKEFEKIMSRDIREYDNEQDLKNAWKVWWTCKALSSLLLLCCLCFVLCCVASTPQPQAPAC